MYSSVRKLFFTLFLIICFAAAKAADTAALPVRIAVLIPLNLDSAFNGYEYNLSNTKISQYFLSGLDFYSGVKMAIDSLQNENANIEVWIYDIHKQNQSLEQLTNEMQSMNFALIIASITNSPEQKAISDFSAKNSIPVISTTFPNDAYLANNPFFLMVNPTWQTHIDAVYNYLLNYSDKKILLFTRKGTLEDKITEELQKMNSKKMINFSTVILNDNFSDEDVLKHLDSTAQNIVLCGSLYENFGRALIKTLNDNGETYQTVLIGMPTWSGMTATTGSDAENIQIITTTPYNYLPGSNSYLDAIFRKYKLSYYSKPSDMVYKGYETMYHFTKLLLAYPGNFINKISDSSYNVSCDYNFQPVRLTQTSFVPDFLENKKIYFIKITGGKIQSIN